MEDLDCPSLIVTSLSAACSAMCGSLVSLAIAIVTALSVVYRVRHTKKSGKLEVSNNEQGSPPVQAD